MLYFEMSKRFETFGCVWFLRLATKTNCLDMRYVCRHDLRVTAGLTLCHGCRDLFMSSKGNRTLSQTGSSRISAFG